ncbi:hypothetical protein [Parendozoicomonas sp. Alg238-R29]|uniref:tetratricopeptide repeat protein n=1 Tax=Parendozoicomonas sp. Alg238-R29 TaxID=2993446 RepID=UPI00248DAF02|nr:hypothetical protein [Parendozoicomonas sp. Alg238-R29]
MTHIRLFISISLLLLSSHLYASELHTQLENANLFMMAGQQEKAEPAFLSIVKQTQSGDPLRTNALIQLLDIAEKRGDPRLASRWVVELLPAYPTGTQQRVNLELRLARHQVTLNNFPVVVNRLAPLIAKNPDNREISLLVAYALVQLDRFKEASPVIDLALTGHSKPPKTWLELQLHIRWALDNWKPATETLLQLLALEPNNSERWRQLASLYSYQDSTANVLASMEIAHRLQPEKASLKELTRGTVVLRANQGQPASAAIKQEQAIASGTIANNEANWVHAASLWLQAKETEKTLSALKKAGIETGEPLWLRGRLLLADERWREAAQDFQKAVKLGKLKHPDHVALLAGYAWWQAKEISKAKSAFQQALAFDDTHQPAQDWLQWIDYMTEQSTEFN